MFSIEIQFGKYRDLLKCCHRLSSLSISKSIDRQLAFHDIVDCFASFLPKANRLSIIQTIGTLFNMNNQEVRFRLCFEKKFQENSLFFRRNSIHLSQRLILMNRINNFSELDMLNYPFKRSRTRENLIDLI